MIEVQIREDRMVLVNDKMEAIAKQAARIQKRTGLTLDLPTVTVTGEEFRTIHLDSSGRKVEPNAYAYQIVDEYIEKWLNVTVTGGSIAIPGWEFVAVIEHADAGNIIRGIRDDIDTSAYRHTPSECVHCNLSRNRNDTYLVLETATGQLRQVGSDCIKDYTGGLDPKAAAAMAAWVSDLMEMIDEGYPENDEYRGGGGRLWLRVDDVLQAAACVVRTQGYEKSRDEWGERNPNGTAATVERDYLFARRFRDDKVEPITAEDIATAAAAKEWGAALIDGDNEFSHNVGVLCSSEYVTIKNLGILCYVPEGLRRDIERKALAAAKADSVFYGSVGEKFTEPVTVVDANRVIESMYVSYLQTFVTDNGAVLKWFASRDQSINVGDRVTLSGTVKAHKEFRGAKETAVTRCKLNA